MASKTVFAVAAHPDDIEFLMAGTLLLLGEAGWELHYMNLASGHCGSVRAGAARVRAQRRGEAQNAARILGAQWHGPLVDDLAVFYEDRTLRRLAAVVREVRPAIILTHSLQDYMEDHMNTARLAVTAAFARGMPNYQTSPRRPAVAEEVTIYHAMPHGLRDGMRRRIQPGQFVDTGSVLANKREALAAHRSQKEWLDASQGFDSYLQAMEDMSREVGKMSRVYRHAEGWRRHLHLGFSANEVDPLAQALGSRCRIHQAYERALKL